MQVLPGGAEVHAEETTFVDRRGPGARNRRLEVAPVDDVSPAPSVVPDVLGTDTPPQNGMAATGLGVERRTWATGQGCQLVACVDVQPASDSDAELVHSDVPWGLAMRRMERCVRPGDRICMLGGSRFGVFLGNGAHRVTPSALGKRVARALGDHLAVGNSGLDLQVSIGIGTGSADVEPAALTAAAMAAIRSTRDQVSSAGSHTPFVAVTHVPSTERRSGLCRRVVVPLLDEEDPQSEKPANGLRTHKAPQLLPASTASLIGVPLRLLIVDADGGHAEGPQAAAEVVGSIARHFGATPIACPPGDPDSVLLNVYISQPDAVVMILQAQPPRRGRVLDGTQPWERPAQLARALRDVGVPVIAVSMGATAATLAVCVEHGAAGLFHPDQLAQELVHLVSGATKATNGTNGSSTNGHDEATRSQSQLPGPYDALVHLTPSERRVLFYLMEGRSATEIATTLVVSLTTVRSHIRSILRKLNVNSQLAAVALAFGTLSVEPSSS